MTDSDPRPNLLAMLRATELLAGAGEPALAACAACFRETRLSPGQNLFLRGDPGGHLYIVAEGRIRLTVATREGRELSVRVAGPGEVLGEISVLDGGARSADATALGAARLYALSQSDADRLIGDHPGFARAIVRFLCGRLRDTTEQLEAIALHPIEVRLARYLLTALRGQKAPPGRRLPLDLGISQGELAQLLGASRPKLNLALGRLETLGALKRTADRLFCDPARLADIADGESE